ncbi:MAG: HlyC/CorC family transporter [Alphaproteobacteria bacterium]
MNAEIWISIAIVIVLMALSAFFSGSETALTAASRPRMQELARQGDPRAATVNNLHARMERMIGALLLGNNAVNIGASALATGVFIGLFGENGVIYATAVMTVLVVIFSEVMPKSFAISDPDRISLAVAPIIRFLVRVLGPLLDAIQWIVRSVLGLFGVSTKSDFGLVTSDEELRGVISLHKGEQPEIKAERQMLHSVLDLDEVDIGKIMTHRSDLVLIDVDEKPDQIVRKVMDSQYTRIPLYRNNPENIVGILHSKDLFEDLFQRKGDMTGFEITKIAGPAWFVPEKTSLLEQLREFRRRHEHLAVVVDEYGTMQGIVTLEDLLEEIVGDISDEHDPRFRGTRGVRAAPDGSYLVNGDVTVRDLNRQFEWNLPDEPASTVAGLIMHEARQIPEVGQAFAFHGFRFEVTRRQGLQITQVRMSRLGGPVAASAGAGTKPPAAQPTPAPPRA